MKKNTKLTLIVFVSITLTFILFSVLTSFLPHECVGDYCSICQLIDSVRRILGMATLISLLCARISVSSYISHAIGVHVERVETPVAQKVKLTS